MLHAVIMAGGAGTRFWPASRVDRPKQLLDLAGNQTMIQATVARLGSLVPPDRVLVVTNQRLVDPIRAQLPSLPAQAVVGEPCKRDTAPCVGLAAIVLSRNDPQATMVVMPADHVISPDEQFQRAIKYAAELVDAQPERIVTFGIRPTYPAEIFGYIQRGERLPASPRGDSPGTYQVARFREKPKAELAQEYVASGEYYWNAGIFVWKASTIMESLARYEPEMYAHLRTIADAYGTPAWNEVLTREFTAIQGKSIDYAVMERAKNAVVIEALYDWDDAGSWQSLARLHGNDTQGNTVIGRHVGVRTTGTIIRSEGEHLIVTVGMQDCIVVHTPDATLVANKHDEEAVREVVKLLQDRGWNQYL